MQGGDWRLQVVRSGGFAGISVPVELGADQIGADELAGVEELVSTTAARGPGRAAPGGAADRFQYDITLERGGQRRHAVVGEGDLTPDQRRLLKQLLARRRAQ